MSEKELTGGCPHCGCPFYKSEALVVYRRDRFTVAAAVALSCAAAAAALVAFAAVRDSDLAVAGFSAVVGMVCGHRAARVWRRGLPSARREAP